MVTPELLQQRYILSFVFASNLSLSRLYITMRLILRTIRAEYQHDMCGPSTHRFEVAKAKHYSHYNKA